MSTRYGATRFLRMLLCGLLVMAAAMVMMAAPAAAHGGGRVFFGFNTWVPPYYPYYYPPYYYYPPPVYAPVPSYGTVQPMPAPASPAAQTCREFQSTVQVDGQWQPSYGTACLQPDGTWRIAN
jgi:hypothetical protein